MKPSLIALASALLLSGCQTPDSVRTLARSSSALITETRVAAPAVQQYFAKQDRLVEGRISRWNDRRRRAESLTQPTETLWALDHKVDSKKTDEKARTELLALIRKPDAEASSAVAAASAAAAQTTDPGSIAKMTGLLEAIASGKSESAGFYLGYWQALSASLDDLNRDAAAAQDAPPADGAVP